MDNDSTPVEARKEKSNVVPIKLPADWGVPDTRAPRPLDEATKTLADKLAAAEKALAEAEAKKWKPDPNDLTAEQIVEALNKEYAFVIYGGKARVAVRKHDDIELIATEDFIKAQSKHSLKTGANKSISYGHLWLSHPDRRSYDRAKFRPELSQIETDALAIYNLFAGFAYDCSGIKSEDEAKALCSIFLEHMHAHICSGDTRNFLWLFGWFADMFQNPGNKPGVAVLLKSVAQGVGKGIIANTMGKLLAKCYVELNKSSDLTGAFTAHLERAILVHLDEASKLKPEHNDTLQSMITALKFLVHPKGMTPFMAACYLRFLDTTNKDDAVHIVKGDRRWAVFKVPTHPETNKKEYFARLVAQLEHNDGAGYKGLLYLLMHFDFKRWNVDVRKIPQTVGLTEQKLESLPPVIKWIKEAAQCGYVQTDEDASQIDGRKKLEADGLIIESSDAYKAFRLWCKINSCQPINNVHMGKGLAEVLKESLRKRRGLYMLPSAAEILKRVATYAQTTVEVLIGYDNGYQGEDDFFKPSTEPQTVTSEQPQAQPDESEQPADESTLEDEQPDEDDTDEPAPTLDPSLPVGLKRLFRGGAPIVLR